MVPDRAEVLVGQALDVNPAAAHGVEPELIEDLSDRLARGRAVLLEVFEDGLVLTREEPGDGVDPLGEHLCGSTSSLLRPRRGLGPASRWRSSGT